jgi:hypothetical protein
MDQPAKRGRPPKSTVELEPQTFRLPKALMLRFRLGSAKTRKPMVEMVTEAMEEYADSRRLPKGTR